MDIRKAKKPVIRKPEDSEQFGTMPPKTVAKEKEPSPIADVNDRGEITIEDFDGDAVVAAYMDYLDKNGITKEDIANVQEALFTTNNVEWQFNLFDKISVCFRIRPAWVDDYIIEILDSLAEANGHVSNIRYNNVVAECNLSASMVQYGDERYEIKTRVDLDNARERTRMLPFVIQNALVKKLSVFDRTVAVATSDWAIKNFMKPQQEK